MRMVLMAAFAVVMIVAPRPAEAQGSWGPDQNPCSMGLPFPKCLGMNSHETWGLGNYDPMNPRPISMKDFGITPIPGWHVNMFNPANYGIDTPGHTMVNGTKLVHCTFNEGKVTLLSQTVDDCESAGGEVHPAAKSADNAMKVIQEARKAAAEAYNKVIEDSKNSKN